MKVPCYFPIPQTDQMRQFSANLYEKKKMRHRSLRRDRAEIRSSEFISCTALSRSLAVVARERSFRTRALSENSVVGPRGNGFSLGKDGEAGDIGFIVDVRLRRRCSQAENKPLEARSSFQKEPSILLILYCEPRKCRFFVTYRPFCLGKR